MATNSPEMQRHCTAKHRIGTVRPRLAMAPSCLAKQRQGTVTQSGASVKPGLSVRRHRFAMSRKAKAPHSTAPRVSAWATRSYAWQGHRTAQRFIAKARQRIASNRTAKALFCTSPQGHCTAGNGRAWRRFGKAGHCGGGKCSTWNDQQSKGTATRGEALAMKCAVRQSNGMVMHSHASAGQRNAGPGAAKARFSAAMPRQGNALRSHGMAKRSPAVATQIKASTASATNGDGLQRQRMALHLNTGAWLCGDWQGHCKARCCNGTARRRDARQSKGEARQSIAGALRSSARPC